MPSPVLWCPSCRARSVTRRSTGATEVDTFDDQLGGWTEHHWEETCSRCGWRRGGVSRTDPSAWAQHQDRSHRLFYTGRDEMLRGALVGTMRIHVPPPDVGVGVRRDDSSRVLARVLEHAVFRATPMTFETDAGTYALRGRLIDLARGATSLMHQLAQAGTARAVVGDGPTLLTVASEPGRVARLLVGDEEHWVGSADIVFGAITEMWRDCGEALAGACDARSPRLGAAFRALTSGLASPLAPIEARGEGLDLLARIAPDVHRDIASTREGIDGPDIWRGARPDTATSFPAQLAAWIAANQASDDAYYLRLRPGHVTMFSRRGGRLAVVTEAYPLADVSGAGARLTFAWAHRTAFVDGLRLFDGELDGAERVRAPGRERLTLIPIHDDHPVLALDPRPSLTLGRSSDNDVVLAHKIVSRRQSVLSARDDGWFVRDAESTSGTYLERERVAGDAALCLGDRLDLGALAVFVA